MCIRIHIPAPYTRIRVVTHSHSVSHSLSHSLKKEYQSYNSWLGVSFGLLGFDINSPHTLLCLYDRYTWDSWIEILNILKKGKNIMLVNFKLKKNIVKILDQLVETGLYKTRVDVVLSAFRNYETFQEKWKRIPRGNAKEAEEPKNTKEKEK
jgi:Arc/MetJ-type ribon-helix-helix transcriptional regulator